MVVLEDEDRVEVLELEGDSLEVDEFDLGQGDDEGRPFGQVDQAEGGRMQGHGGAERHAEEAQIWEGRVEVDLVIRLLANLQENS